ncbi:MAG: glycosyltransferase [Bacilli bacterium]
MPKISILVPVYNVFPYLEDALNSIVNQTLKDIEIIIINDGSTDKSQVIIDEFSRKHTNIKSFNCQHKGVSSTRNFALSKANGEYIGFVDSDDTVLPNMYEELYNMAKKENADIVISDFNEVHNDFTILKSGLFNNDISNTILHLPSLCNKIIKKELYIKNNISFPDISIGEDMTVIIQLLDKSVKTVYLNKAFYNYYKRPNSLMNKKTYSKYWNDIFIAFDILNNKLSKKYSEELEYLFIQHVLKDSSIKFMYYKEGKESLKKIVTITKQKYKKFRKNKYFKMNNYRYKVICKLLYYKQYWLVKIIRKILNSER